MKRCPYCGAVLTKEDALFCTECGKDLSAKAKKEHPASTGAKERREKRRKQNAQIPEITGEAVDDDYDGYYNDVLPPDLDRVGEGVDKKLIKKIVILAIAAAFIISLCVVMMYLV